MYPALSVEQLIETLSQYPGKVVYIHAPSDGGYDLFSIDLVGEMVGDDVITDGSPIIYLDGVGGENEPEYHPLTAAELVVQLKQYSGKRPYVYANDVHGGGQDHYSIDSFADIANDDPKQDGCPVFYLRGAR